MQHHDQLILSCGGLNHFELATCMSRTTFGISANSNQISHLRWQPTGRIRTGAPSFGFTLRSHLGFLRETKQQCRYRGVSWGFLASNLTH